MKFDHRLLMPTLLSAVVLVPSATVLWLASVAARNEHAAVRARLVDSYKRQLQLASAKVNDHFQAMDKQYQLSLVDETAGKRFDQSVRAKLAPSILVYDEEGIRSYPPSSRARLLAGLNQNAWQQAERLEFSEEDLLAAAQMYSAIASLEPNPDVEAMAWIAHARCLSKAGQADKAVVALKTQFERQPIQQAHDELGKSLWVFALLRSAQLLKQSSSQSNEDVSQVRQALRNALAGYQVEMPSSQRLFAMRMFGDLYPDASPFPTFEAESIAEQYLLQTQDRINESENQTARDDIVRVDLPRSRIGLLYRKSELQDLVDSLVADFADAETRLKLQDLASSDPDSIASAQIKGLKTHHLMIAPLRPGDLDEPSKHQRFLYISAGIVTMGSVLALVLAVRFFVSKQLRLAQTKADLATLVAHELRTPLASIRLLVDTLLDGTVKEQKHQTEYLRLIASENERLTRLIENVLTFSSLQRRGQRFDIVPTKPATLAERTVEAMAPKFERLNVDFSHHIPPSLPNVMADADAITIVLINLLDNALKFTGDTKKICFSMEQHGQQVQFHVNDNGVGIKDGDRSQIFDRFYQADTRLSRTHGGCGLGLSLVESIVKAHDGSISLESEVDKGSTFTVSLPIESEQQDARGNQA